MAIPLLLITSEAIKEKKQQNAIRQIINAKFPRAIITSVNIEDKNEVVIIDVTIQHSDILTENQVDNLADIFSQKMDNSVVPRITIVPIVKLWENGN